MRLFIAVRNFFKKFVIGIKRINGDSLPFTPTNKKVGSHAEIEVFNEIKQLLPNASVIKNVCIDEKLAKGEIDFVIVYKTKVFILELKAWRGRIYQEKEYFYQNKESSIGEVYTNEISNPFKQIKRNLYHIKQRFPNVWFEPLVLFVGPDDIEINESIKWFISVSELVNYIKWCNTNTTHGYNIFELIKNIKSYDVITSSLSFGREIFCIINDSSLKFTVDSKIIKKTNIQSIRINHHFTYDDVEIKLINKEIIKVQLENYKIVYSQNEKRYSVSFSKIDYIEVNNK